MFLETVRLSTYKEIKLLTMYLVLKWLGWKKAVRVQRTWLSPTFIITWLENLQPNGSFIQLRFK